MKISQDEGFSDGRLPGGCEEKSYRKFDRKELEIKGPYL